MSRDHDKRQSTTEASRPVTPSFEAEHDPAIARRTSLSQLRAIQMKLGGGATENVHDAAARGVASPTTSLPHADKIQASFGSGHDVSQIRAHVGGDSAKAMGASAFASGNDVVFDRTPDLHTAAHEAAHVVQQAQGVNLYGGVGEAGDSYERHADAVADRVVAGRSAADLLGASPTGSASTAVQRKDITDGTTKQHADAHDDADRYGADAFASKVDLLAVRMRTAATDIDHARMAPHDGDAGIYANIGIVQELYTRIRNDAEDLYRAAALEKSLSGAEQSVMHTDFGILVGAFALFNDSCNRAMNWGRNDGLDADPTMVGRWVDNTLASFGVKTTDITPVYKNDRVDDRSVEELENQTLKDSVAAIHACAKAVRMNVKTSTEAELGGDLYKMMEAVHATKEILTSIDLKTRIGKMPSLKAALDELGHLDSELHAAQPSLAKRLSDSTYSFDLRTLHTIVATHHPKSK